MSLVNNVKPISDNSLRRGITGSDTPFNCLKNFLPHTTFSIVAATYFTYTKTGTLEHLMLKLTKIAVAASAIIVLSTHFTLANTSEYKLIAFEDCTVVAEAPLDQSQVDAYLALKASEKRMEAVSQPVESLDEDIDRYSDQISELTNLAIQEDDETLQINKKLLQKQEALAKELQSLIKHHESKFKALEEEARVIEAAAKAFENAIRPAVKGIEYDLLQIVGPEDKNEPYDCDGDRTMILM